MIYEEGMLCKHFKGKKLVDKTIYKIEKLNVSGKDVDQSIVTYIGDGDLSCLNNLVVYSDMFLENKLFVSEYEDISSELSIEDKINYNQIIKVQPLTKAEIDILSSSFYLKLKKDSLLKDCSVNNKNSVR